MIKKKKQTRSFSERLQQLKISALPEINQKKERIIVLKTDLFTSCQIRVKA